MFMHLQEKHLGLNRIIKWINPQYHIQIMLPSVKMEHSFKPHVQYPLNKHKGEEKGHLLNFVQHHQSLNAVRKCQQPAHGQNSFIFPMY
jgi:hypothetical protein